MNAWIRIVDEAQAGGGLGKIYEEVRRSRGRISNVMKAHSLDPKAMQLHLQLYLHLMYGKSSLTRSEREMIAVLVSHLNRCQYCVTHHEEALQAHVHDYGLVDSIKADFRNASVSGRDKVMLEYAAKLTGQPGQVGEEDVTRMRLEGFSDDEILQVNLITSYFNFVNRIVSGLGVPLEDPEERVYRY